MAIGWLTVLQTVPWTEVIRNAPKLAEGAKKLWNTVAGKPATPGAAAQAPAVSREAHSVAAVATRVTQLEAATADLHTEMLASSELIKALADQNAQLVQRVESNRRHMLWLGATAALALVVAFVALWAGTR